MATTTVSPSRCVGRSERQAITETVQDGNHRPHKTHTTTVRWRAVKVLADVYRSQSPVNPLEAPRGCLETFAGSCFKSGRSGNTGTCLWSLLKHQAAIRAAVLEHGKRLCTEWSFIFSNVHINDRFSQPHLLQQLLRLSVSQDIALHRSDMHARSFVPLFKNRYRLRKHAQ